MRNCCESGSFRRVTLNADKLRSNTIINASFLSIPEFDVSNLQSFVESLDSTHCCQSFDCGVAALNTFLHKHALQNQLAESARTYVASVVTDEGEQAVGFYTLTAASIAPEDTPERIRKGLARHPVAAILLVRLAVDQQRGRAWVKVY